MKCTERSFAVLCIVLAVPLSLSAGNSMRAMPMTPLLR